MDTAEAYRNERAVGEALKESGVPRAEVFLATKISFGKSRGYAETKALVARQLADLGTAYVDPLLR